MSDTNQSVLPAGSLTRQTSQERVPPFGDVVTDPASVGKRSETKYDQHRRQNDASTAEYYSVFFACIFQVKMMNEFSTFIPVTCI